jgi:diguanylate cyclase (GGDEF)-like protein
METETMSPEMRVSQLETENSLLREDNEAKDEKIQKLEKLAYWDQKTGLLNLNGLQKELAERKLHPSPEEIENERREKKPTYSVMIVDIDRFKSYNDTFGHDVGDDVLKAVAKGLESQLRQSDIVARWGGEELVVVFGGTDERRVLEKFYSDGRARLNIPVEIEGVNFIVTLSGGVANFNPDEEVFDQALKRADNALYAAKEGKDNLEGQGRDRILGVEQLQKKEFKESIK